MAAPFVLGPDSSVQLGLESLCLIAIICECILIPYSIAFGTGLRPIYAFSVTALFVVDIVANFRTGFHYYGAIIMDPQVIRYHYITQMFLLDLVATIPWDMLLQGGAVQQFSNLGRTGRALRALRLVRLLKLVRILRSIERYVPLGLVSRIGLLLETVKFFLVFLMLSHWVACIWRFLGESPGAAEVRWDECDPGGACEAGVYGSPWLARFGITNSDRAVAEDEVYVLALELGVGVMTGAGLGALPPGTLAERLTGVVLSVLATLFSAYVVARFTEVCARLVAQNSEMVLRQNAVDQYTHLYGISKQLAARVKFYLASRFGDMLEMRKDPQRETMILELPEVLRQEVLANAYGGLLRFHPFFAALSGTCMTQIFLTTQKLVFVRGDVVRKSRAYAIPTTDHIVTETEGIQFLLRGTVVQWDISSFLRSPAWFDAEVFFALHGSCRVAAPELYATEYTEVVKVAREPALRVLQRFPADCDEYVRRLITIRWRSLSRNCLRAILVASNAEATSEARRTSANARRASRAARRTLRLPPTMTTSRVAARRCDSVSL